MPRTTNVISISLPPPLNREAGIFAEKKHMTKSEFLRLTLRYYIEEQEALEGIRVARKETQEGRLKTLRGPISRLMRA